MRLADLQYERNDYGFKRGSFRIRGESIDLFPAYLDNGIHIEKKTDFINEIYEF